MVRIDASNIVDWDTFHGVFASAFGFPAFYGRNMNAWIDCLTDLDDPEAGMTTVHVGSGECLSLVIDQAQDFRIRCPELFSRLMECAAFVNWRRIGMGRPPVLALAFHE
jgi:hypothetical protein